MHRYLYTSDLRISELAERIQSSAVKFTSGISIKDKSEANNAATLQFYFNLESETKTLTDAVENPISAIRNYLVKFQFPNTRTEESLQASIEQKMFLAPYRAITAILWDMISINGNTSASISMDEILYYVFCNPTVYTNPEFNVRTLVNIILEGRNKDKDYEALIENSLEWNQYGRQSRELITVLSKGCECFNIKKGSLTLDINNASEDDMQFIEELRSYSLFWYPTIPKNFHLSHKEYISYMDTKPTPYSVIQFRKTNSFPKVLIDLTPTRRAYLSAIRTKPFLLLAGISGTGKSRIVKELAYSSCPNQSDLRSDPTSPGNYCLVEVKPNWNESTELLGYETVLDGGGYHLTKFVKFLIKAMQYEDVPFFVCLDEMNLAPVEQYFAEFLSVLESRKDVLVNGQRTIQSEPLIDGAIFKKYSKKLYTELFPEKEKNPNPISINERLDETRPIYFNGVYLKLMEEGLRIPHNLIVVGTVNMDDTTYQFSRKVIDRAMTIEMNEVDLDNILDNDKADALSYPEEVLGKENFFAPFAQSREALPEIDDVERTQLVDKIKETIGQTDKEGKVTEKSLEFILGKTPFRIAYRVVNELILHFYALRWQDNDTPFEELYYTALDNILMMKVLPRIEGNEDLVRKPLTALQEWTNGSCPKSNQKIREMITRLDSHFTSFWP